MAGTHEPGILAEGEKPVRRFLLGLGMPEVDIGLYLDEARQGPGPATFSFGADDEGQIPEFSLSCETSDFVLTEVQL
jgi:hypothetical protein